MAYLLRTSFKHLLLWLLLLPIVLTKNLGQPGNRPSEHNNTEAEFAIPNEKPGPACSAKLKKVATNRNLSKRPFSWESLVANGRENRCSMEAHQNQVDQSDFDANDVGDLQQYDWILSPSNPGRVRTALGDLEMRRLIRAWPDGLDMGGTAEPVFTANSYIHGRPSTATYQPTATAGRPPLAPRHYNPTYAAYAIAINVQYGVLITKWGSLWEPEKAIKAGRSGDRRYTGGPVATLSSWGDISFLNWIAQRASAMQHLDPNARRAAPVIEYILFHDVELEGDEEAHSDEIVDCVFEALERTRSGNPGAPAFNHKRTFTCGDPRGGEAFHALLGTHAGDLVTGLLSEHKADLGLRKVTDISIFDTGSTRDRYDRERVHAGLIFKIEAGIPPSGATTPGLSRDSESASGGSGGENSGGNTTPQNNQAFENTDWAERYWAANHG